MKKIHRDLVLGPSNDADTPEDEIHLAMLIQNAASRELVSCQHALYREPRMPTGMYTTKSTACCAAGAAILEQDTQLFCVKYPAYVSGNNAEDGEGAEPWADGVGFTLGAAFEQALRPEVES